LRFGPPFIGEHVFRVLGSVPVAVGSNSSSPGGNPANPFRGGANHGIRLVHHSGRIWPRGTSGGGLTAQNEETLSPSRRILAPSSTDESGNARSRRLVCRGRSSVSMRTIKHTMYASNLALCVAKKKKNTQPSSNRRRGYPELRVVRLMGHALQVPPCPHNQTFHKVLDMMLRVAARKMFCPNRWPGCEPAPCCGSALFAAESTSFAPGRITCQRMPDVGGGVNIYFPCCLGPPKVIYDGGSLPEGE